MAIEVFRTNVESRKHADMLLRLLETRLPELSCNFDLEDCDRILRIKAEQIIQEKIVELLNAEGFCCKPL